MTQSFPRVLFVICVLVGVLATNAVAQDVPFQSDRSLVPAQYPRWDVGGSLSILTMSKSETRSPWNDWNSLGEFRADVGRYWTTHLKTEVAIATSNQWDDFESVAYPVPGATARTFAYIDYARQLRSVAPALTWQFRENTFMHPYVSGGVKVGMLREHRTREGGTFRIGSLSYAVTPLDERSTTVTARPFVAGGFKSYVSRSVYVRTEARAAFGSDGLRQLTLGAGMGVDF